MAQFACSRLLWCRGAGFVVASLLASAGTQAQVSTPATLPDIPFHLTARHWQPLDTARDVYLDRIEGIVRYEATLQSASGALIDPVQGIEWQYATPYFANALGVLMSAGRAKDLLADGVAALNSSTAQMAKGNAAIPQKHGNFFLAPMADAMSLYSPFVSTSQLDAWRSRMQLPVADLTQPLTHNWRSYAMKGEWYRARQGLVSTSTATGYIEDSWINTQRARLTGDPWNLYHDGTSDPDTFAYDAAARANLWNLLSHGYAGPSATEMRSLIARGTQSGLLLQDATGQAPVGGRSGLHSWNDVYSGLGFEMMAEQSLAEGKTRLAGQYRHAALLALRSVDRWRSADGYYFVTKNHFPFDLRVGYAEYSALTNYNGNVAYHLAETWRARTATISEQPAPVEIGGYAWQPDASFGVAFANAGGMQLEASLRGAVNPAYGQYWTTLGITRFSRVGWDSRLGPSDGIRDIGTKLGISYAPTFLENGSWTRLASQPWRYQGKLTVLFAHPLLVRARFDYAPVNGQSGPTFADNLVITPDGVLSTITSSAAVGSYGVTWPVLANDGAALVNRYTAAIASLNFPGGGDEQNFIALGAAPTLTTAESTLRSAYGDLRPVRMLPGGTDAPTFIYPRSPWDPSAEGVRSSFRRSGADFSSLLGRVKGNLYVGRSAAGGFGAGIDLDGNGVDDVSFSAPCNFILQLSNGRVTAIETDRSLNAVVQGQSLTVTGYVPVTLGSPSDTSADAKVARLAGGATVQACSTCAGGDRVGYLGNGGNYNGTASFTLDAPRRGNYVATLYYSNADVATRFASLSVNGATSPSVAFASTGTWDTMAPLDVVLDLDAGSNTLTIGNSGAKAPSFSRLVLHVP